jgi:hypothetical protein
MLVALRQLKRVGIQSDETSPSKMIQESPNDYGGVKSRCIAISPPAAASPRFAPTSVSGSTALS